MIYTSYFGQLRNLVENDIEPIAISRGVPKGYVGLRRLDLAPTWAMLKMPDEQYNRCYEEILSRVDVHRFIEEYEGRDVALLCWEHDINDCHRKRVAEWLREAGCEVKEFEAPEVEKKPKEIVPKDEQLSFF